jgi:DNA-binding transcriptional MerR regulator
MRMWEQRYGFPAPRRRESGHRRYSERDCVVLRDVRHHREAGASMAAAIEHATKRAELAETSIYAGIRHRHPHLEPAILPQPFMLAISRAIEQEASAYGAGAVLVGCFEQRRAWRAAETRWRKLAANGHVAVVFADFPDAGSRDGVWTVPIDAGTGIGEEWAVICDGPQASACVVGVELPRADPRQVRRFEAVWSVDPRLVRDAARLAIGLAIRQLPALASVADVLARRAETPPAALEQASALTNRVIANALDIGRASTRA